MCPPLPDIDNGVVDWSGLSPGGVATYTCDPGFILVGNPTRICRDDGTWSGEERTCERKLLSPLHVYCSTTSTYCYCVAIMCPPLPDIDNGMVEWSGLSPEDVATYTCDPGFILVGEPTRVCRDDETWSGEEPTCERKLLSPLHVYCSTTSTYCYCLAIMCPPLPDIDNGMVEWSGLSPEDVATYTCDPGFILVGEPTRVCRDDETWSVEEPTCERKLLSPLHVYCSTTSTYCYCVAIMCPPLPDIDNGMVEWSGLSPEDVATYTCDPGFILVGEPTRVCRDDETWSGEEPTCERKLLSPLHVYCSTTSTYCYCLAIMCPPLPDIDNGVVDWSGLSPGGVATYTCDPGFILVGEPTRICRDDGTWSDEEPTCECKLLSPLHVYCSSTCTYCCIIYIIV